MARGNHNPVIAPRSPSPRIKKYVRLFFGLLLSVCTQIHAQSTKQPSWFLGFGAPDYMEVWIETADVVDIRERVFRRAGAGIASVSTPTNNTGTPAGWPDNPGSGAGREVNGADLPRLIYVRWQSLAEPQTYEAYIVIPESAREIMRKPEKAFCRADGKWITDYRDDIGIGLAPGGIAKVWLGGPCLKAVEIARVEGTINPKGPYEGKSGGKHRPLTDVSKTYIEKFGIPYGSW
ncbi:MULTISPECIES: DUF2931 family protein [unclassified Pseudomonas]|uniref:DUF2931 family protein n=1 Tax=unclassified Pseudomonas TaxID=196821 RepID=UPI001B31DA2D|nr:MULTISPECIES: DUF2931 family protein [unclassified Pseudomonas]MBP5943918.1 DUF2931 family protein [Pseudomonas sp. P9(2020)]MBZ9563053.1 DUF2931 family protein [Pseudomonas sp. P116]